MARNRARSTRAQLVAAAQATFAKHGLDRTLVSDIVRAAGVAQGTFYLYFKSKEDMVAAVAEELTNEMLGRVEEASVTAAASAAERLRAVCGVLGEMATLQGIPEVVELIHRPGNRAIHDRMVARALPRLVAVLEDVIEQGVAEGTFHVPSAQAAAWFVLSGLQGTELAGVPVAETPSAMAVAAEFALRALGYDQVRL